MCAKLPPFLQSEADTSRRTQRSRGGYRGSNASTNTLRNVFLQEIARDPRGKEWSDAFKNGRQFREFYSRLCSGREFNAARYERWLRKLEAWAVSNPGVGYPSDGTLS